MTTEAVEVTEWDGRRAVVWVEPGKAPAMRALSDVLDEIAELRDRPFAHAVARAMLEAARAGILDGRMSDEDGLAWVEARATAILAEEDADATA